MKKRYARLQREGRVRSHRTNPAEIAGLFAVVERDLSDAALQAATAMMYAEGYRTSGGGHHWATFEFLKQVSPVEFGDLADYFDDCRRKRNRADYVGVGCASETEARHLLMEARRFAEMARTWIRERHPGLMPV